MENTNQTTPSSEESLLQSIQDKANELKELAGDSLENIQEKTEDLIEKIKSGEMIEEGKSMLNNLMSGDAKDKIGNLAEEAKGLWDKITGGEKKAE
ncbi:MAG: hypothetical protein WCJ80_14590 [Bacteroidota bacterium]|jgi:coenzyme F420-reducing hydrogenase alpha subunit